MHKDLNDPIASYNDLKKIYDNLSMKFQFLSDFLIQLSSEEQNPDIQKVRHEQLIAELRVIIGGERVRPEEFPECCVIGENIQGGIIRWNFSGVLIHPSAVLTAAHCVENNKNYTVALNAEDLIVTPRMERIGSTRVVVHSGYSTNPTINDIAIIVLERRANTPVAEVATSAELTASSKVTLVGFGKDRIDTISSFGVKRKVTVDIRKEISETVFGYDAQTEFVAGGNGLDSCKGDSGGPAYIIVDAKRKVAGVTSRDIKNPARACGDGGVYSRTDAHTSFINSTIKDL